MGFFGKRNSQPPPDVGSETSSTVAATDSEKGEHKPLGNQIDTVIEKRIVRKLDHRVLSLLGFLFMLSILDRGNIGNARIAGLEKDLKLHGEQYDWLLTIFYISWVIFSFQGFMWRIVKPHYWGAFIVLAWGTIAACQAAALNWSSMMALRFLLGATEAGYSQSIPFLLSFFYNRKEIGFRIGIWGIWSPIASCFAGALAYGITNGHSHLANWRLLFLVEGVPTMLMAPVTYFLLPDSASTARFLTQEEREVAKLRTEKQHGKVESESVTGGLNFKEIWATLLDPVSWCICLMYFAVNVSYASMPVFLPTIIKEMGYSSINAQGLSAPPYFACIFVVLLTTWIADRTQERGLMIAGLSLVGGAGYVMMATCTAWGPRYAGTFLAICGGFTAIAHLLAWVVNNQGSVTRRGMGVALMSAIGQCGPILGTRMFPLKDGPRYVKGGWVCGAFLFFNAIVAVVMRQYCAWKNRKWDEQYGPRVERGDDAGVEDDGDENYGRNYRYVL